LTKVKGCQKVSGNLEATLVEIWAWQTVVCGEGLVHWFMVTIVNTVTDYF